MHANLTNDHPQATSPGTPRTATDPTVAAALQASLADTLRLSLLVKHAHWNVTGPRFRSLHLLLDELAAVTRNAADEIAERAAAIGVPPDGRPGALPADGPHLGSGPLPDTDLIEDLVSLLTATSNRIAGAIQDDLASDLVSQSILIDFATELDKHTWMLAAQR